jgi:hypothetical protein
MLITRPLLDSYLGKNISQICPAGYHSPGDNHCAHFVSHVLNLRFGLTCSAMKGSRTPGVNIRVQEVFRNCPEAKELMECSMALPAGLIVVSDAKHFLSSPGFHEIRNVPAKHIGIYLLGNIWHYSNSGHQVVSQDMTGFIHHYSRTAKTNALWWASFPLGANAEGFDD